ncbi:MAG: DNA-directed RNA polymerase subunit omega [Alphaproteobacteria bacterium]|nr:DNA-directed RNA polymerase subunit omega [Alphaproteobacteria bacterium]
MARITSEIASNKIGNKYDMILIAVVRARELGKGNKPKMLSNNKPIVTAIREIEQGLIGKEYLRKIR